MKSLLATTYSQNIVPTAETKYMEIGDRGLRVVCSVCQSGTLESIPDIWSV